MKCYSCNTVRYYCMKCIFEGLNKLNSNQKEANVFTNTNIILRVGYSRPEGKNRSTNNKKNTKEKDKEKNDRDRNKIHMTRKDI